MAQVILFAREPLPGRVKTRLAPALGADGACDLYRAFVADAVTEWCARPGFRVTVAHDPDPVPTPFLADLCRAHGASLVAQSGAGLGERMAGALRDRIAASGDAALLIGTDLPTLPCAHLDAALRLLARHPLVFNPASDGGYYLAGASPAALKRWDAVRERLFTGIPWSSGATLHATLARKGDLDVALGPPWHDVDGPADLDLLRAHLRRAPAPPLTHTRALLAGWGWL